MSENNEKRTHVNHCGITKGDFFLREFNRDSLYMISQWVTETLEDNYSIIEVNEEILDIVKFLKCIEQYTMSTRGEE